MMHHRFGRLQARLLLWFLGAIFVAIGASVVTTILTAPETETPTRVVSRHVQHRLAKLWDDPVATDAYVAQLRDTTGLDLHVTRDPSIVVGRESRPAANGWVFEEGAAYIPIIKNGTTVGALELRTASAPPRLWRVGLALGAALLVLGGAARRVSKRLARPLEHVAKTAERFGAGDLDARTHIESQSQRWVAEEVREVGRAFDGMADRISRVVTDQRELLAAISHELRSPLGRARVAIEIARERAGEGSATTRPLEDADKQLVEVDAILGDLLASARAGLADVRLEEVDLVPWLRTRIESETTGHVEIEVDDAARDARVEIDPALFGRALHNLLANAWAHGHPKEAPLVVRVGTQENEAIIAVRDRGPGFDEDLLARAFEPFVTGGNSARSPGQGIGLGLALVRRIVEAHHGSASAKNAASGGAEVEIRLPLA
jgi:signal transduction histidine kinase